MARVLQFPALRRAADWVSPDEASRIASDLIAQGLEGSGEELLAFLTDAEVLSALTRQLRSQWNSRPAFVASQAAQAYRCLDNSDKDCGLFDERDYFLGEMALLAAGANRMIGKRDEAEAWLDRADAGYRHTVNPAPQLAQVSYTRVAIRYDRRRYDEVLELLPSVQKSFEKLGMREDVVKVRFLEAMTFKESARHGEARQRFAALRKGLDASRDRTILGQVMIETGAIAAEEENYDLAISEFQGALPLLKSSGALVAVAHLQMNLGEMFARQGRLQFAVAALREAIETYRGLEMTTFVAYSRVIAAETLIAAGQPREAEWEILQALPTIEEQKMVPEGFAAVALLRESVKQRKADPNALRELREHLQKQN